MQCRIMERKKERQDVDDKEEIERELFHSMKTERERRKEDGKERRKERPMISSRKRKKKDVGENDKEVWTLLKSSCMTQRR